jgi:peptidoglycan/xylan/chitin deacetylase (PgdA/CDA1 family)
LRRRGRPLVLKIETRGLEWDHHPDRPASMPKPLASISLDLDNKWSYLKTHGDEAWSSFPSYFPAAIPRILDFCAARDLSITVFIVGQDAALPANHAHLRSIAQAGHEIANHSFHHEPWLHEYDRGQLHAELEAAETALVQATGQRPVGFRGPGFSISEDVIRVLAERGYRYDATVFPTFLGPLARAYYFLHANLSRQEQSQRKALFGRMRDGFRPLRPFEWNLPEQRLVEIPVTTMPFAKVPIHLSYLVYLSKYSALLARTYFWQALQLCRVAGVEPSLLLHPTDFLGCEDVSDMAFFPGMDLPAARKLAIVAAAVDGVRRYWEPRTLREHAEAALSRQISRCELALLRPARA